MLDQRGSGQSRPYASLEHNTTQDLVADLERLRVFLGIERWQVFGGSWGSTLGLAYAQQHPQAVTALVMYGIFLCRKAEVHWMYQDGASHMFPDRWEVYRDEIPEGERADMVGAYRKRLTGADEATRVSAARAWSHWENTTKALYPPTGEEAIADDPEDFKSVAMARIENHYFVNGGFFENERQILDGVEKIRHIPATIVQGRYDVVCPPSTAWELHREWPVSFILPARMVPVVSHFCDRKSVRACNLSSLALQSHPAQEADFTMVQDSGHTKGEPGTIHELIEATERYKDRIAEL